MKIINLEIFLLKCPPPQTPVGPTASFVFDGSICLRIVTDVGLTGLGEPSPYGGDLKTIRSILENDLRPNLIGRSVCQAFETVAAFEASDGTGYGNVPHHAALAGVDQALWDLTGKAEGQPLYKLLKSRNVSNRVRAYASGGMSHQHENPVRVIDEAVRCRRQGYTAWKMRPGTPENASHLDRTRRPPAIGSPMIEYAIVRNPLRRELVDTPLTPENGEFVIPDRPGLGVELNDDAIRRYAFA